jgi:hypothetical protein
MNADFQDSKNRKGIDPKMIVFEVICVNLRPDQM